MLPKKYRLTRQEFNLTKSLGKTTRTPTYTLFQYPNHQPYSRLAVVVSKKISKLATRRNFLRRFIFSRFAASQGFDSIVILHSSVSTLTTPDLTKIFGPLASK